MKNLNKVRIIAEAGVNHNGNLKIAKKLIVAAKRAGADYVKFQYFKAEYLSTKYSKQAKYQKKKFKQKNNSQKLMLEKLQLSIDQLNELKDFCQKKKIKFALSVFDHITLKLLIPLNLDFIKIPSGEITNYPLLRNATKISKEIILSTGMSNITEIKKAIETIKKYNKKIKITLMHCTTEYPTNEKDVNILSVKTMEKKFKLSVGYSDHTKGNEASCAAAVLGSRTFEKHFTLSRRMKGPDHSASLEPDELLNYILSIKKTINLIGNGKKKITRTEKKNFNIVRKSIYALKKIKLGDIFTEENIISKRPYNKSNPMNWLKILGKKSKKKYNIDEEIIF